MNAQEIKNLEEAEIRGGNHFPCLLQRSPRQSLATDTSWELNPFYCLSLSLGPVKLKQIFRNWDLKSAQEFYERSYKVHRNNKSSDTNATFYIIQANKQTKKINFIAKP